MKKTAINFSHRVESCRLFSRGQRGNDWHYVGSNLAGRTLRQAKIDHEQFLISRLGVSSDE